VGAGIGSQIAPAFRADLVDAYRTYRGGYGLSDADQGSPPSAFDADISSHSVMANVYWDIPLPAVSPFIWWRCRLGATGFLHSFNKKLSSTAANQRALSATIQCKRREATAMSHAKVAPPIEIR